MSAPRPKRHYGAAGQSAPIRWPKQATLDGQKVYGHMFIDTGAISVSSRYTEAQQAWTLLHEFLHVVFPEWGEPMVLDGEARFGSHLERNREAWLWILENLGGERPRRG